MRIKKVLCLFKCHDFKQIVEGFANLEYYTPTALTQGKYCAAPAWKTWTESCYMTQFLRIKKKHQNWANSNNFFGNMYKKDKFEVLLERVMHWKI